MIINSKKRPGHLNFSQNKMVHRNEGEIHIGEKLYTSVHNVRSVLHTKSSLKTHLKNHSGQKSNSIHTEEKSL